MLYSFGRIRICKRGQTKSAVASAAYYGAQKYTNEWDGVTHNFSRKKYVEEQRIRMPENAPEKYINESIPVAERVGLLWNDVENFEKAGNAQLARHNYIALQHDLTIEQNLECVDRWIKENCTSIGMGVVYAPHLQPNNWHVDVMYLMREFDTKGNFKIKSEKAYLCRNASGEERYILAKNWKKEKDNGWEKIYKYQSPEGEKRNFTKSELEKESGTWERTSKYPLDKKIEVNTWNDHDMADKWRKSWEVIVNEKFEELGLDLHVDCRSYEDQGSNKIPAVHVGNSDDKEERESLNKDIIDFNERVDELQEEIEDILIETIAGDLEYVTAMDEEDEDDEYDDGGFALEDQADTLNDIERDALNNQQLINRVYECDLFEKTWRKKLKERYNNLLEKLMEKLNSIWAKITQRRSEPVLDEFKQSPLDNIIKSAKEEQEALWSRRDALEPRHKNEKEDPGSFDHR